MNPKAAILKLLGNFMMSIRSRGVAHKDFGKDLVIGAGSRVKAYSRDGAVTIGNNVIIGKNSDVFVWTGKLKIGDNTSMNDNCKIYENVTIGANCLLASNIFLSSGSHVFRHRPALPIRSQDNLVIQDKPIVIDDDCWLGFGVVVMQGVHIGKGAVIGANSVITRDVPPYSIQGGIPSKELSQRVVFDPPLTIHSDNEQHWPYFYNGIDYKSFDNIADLVNGIPVVQRHSMFVLKKTGVKKLTIKGQATARTQIRFSVDGIVAGDVQSEAGSFEKTFDIGTTHAPGIGVPKSLQEKYTICTAETLVAGTKWRAKSISIE